jgi:hypothetical protein
VTEEDLLYRYYQSAEDALAVYHLNREKEYKTEPHLYLSGSAVALLFDIGRLTDLNQEHVELEQELDTMRLSNSTSVDSSTGEKSCGQEIEFNSIQSKK